MLNSLFPARRIDAMLSRTMTIRDLRGKRCVITGAASGIGRATAMAAARAGAALVLTDRDADALAKTVRDAQEAGALVVASRAFDVTDLEAMRAFATDVHARGGSVDVLMNIAGVSTWGRVQHLQHHHWKKMIDVNLMGPIHAIECFVPPMIEAGRGGHLVNVSSAAGLLGLPWHAAYSASKFGLRGVSEVLRFDLARHRIGVSLVCPGAVKTPLVSSVEIVGIDRDDARMKSLVTRFQKHAVSPEHVANVILEGIRKNRYLVFTSFDIRLGFALQNTFPLPYELAMRALNEVLDRASAKRGG